MGPLAVSLNAVRRGLPKTATIGTAETLEDLVGPGPARAALQAGGTLAE